MTIVLNISQKGIDSSGSMKLFSANLRYRPPQNAKFIGVVKMQAAVLNAVSDTDSSVFPLDREVMKFEMLPPGQDATRSIPRAIIGEIIPFIAIARRSVRQGSSTSWQIIPMMMDFGFCSMLMKVAGLMPSATPNITNARTMFMMFIPVSFMLTFIASI